MYSKLKIGTYIHTLGKSLFVAHAAYHCLYFEIANSIYAQVKVSVTKPTWIALQTFIDQIGERTQNDPGDTEDVEKGVIND